MLPLVTLLISHVFGFILICYLHCSIICLFKILQKSSKSYNWNPIGFF